MKILLAVSGGIDSMYMANRASELIPGARFAVAHCNFLLRGEDSDADETFVRDWCREKGLTCHVRRFDTEAEAAARGISIEMAARDLRYAWFEELCREHGYAAVALAHNANDNAETLMLNLLRGTGSRGIRGMSEREGIIRPLLGTGREQIKAWMEEAGLSWREDRTNGENIYRRNMIRNEVFPVFARINPSFVRTLNADMQHFAQVDDIAEDYFRQAQGRITDERGDIIVSALMRDRHWEFLLWRMLEGCGLGAKEFESLVDTLRCGRQIGGKTFGSVTGGSDRLIIKERKAMGQLRWEIVPRSSITSLRTPKGVLIADADKLAFPLNIRPWKEGDWMHPLGMRGRKKLSDMFTDLKWSAPEKERAEVIELDGSHVAALLCERIDDSIKVDESTRRVLVLDYSSMI